MGLARDDDRGAAHARVDRRRALAGSVGRERGRPARPTGQRRVCGRSCSTGTRAGTSGLCTGSPATCTRSCAAPRLQARGRALRRTTASILEETAFVENGLANWPPAPRDCARERDGRDPGPVVPRCARHRRRGSAIPRRGARPRGRGAHLARRRRIATPRGPGICHGTAGNGYALLQAFERTGDERWLERARRFAVHALAQVRRQRAARGRGRYSLLTGDRAWRSTSRAASTRVPRSRYSTPD